MRIDIWNGLNMVYRPNKNERVLNFKHGVTRHLYHSKKNGFRWRNAAKCRVYAVIGLQT